MASTDDSKPAGKPGRRNRKTDQRKKKPEQISETVAPTDAAPIDMAASAETAPIDMAAPAETAPIDADAPADTAAVGEAAPPESDPIAAAAPADTAPVSLQTIANAYGDFTRKSLEETRSFVEKLKGVRSLEKAVELQSEFARQTHETFVADSQKICELYTELARQIFKPL
jgi:hypothetical protein